MKFYKALELKSNSDEILYSSDVGICSDLYIYILCRNKDLGFFIKQLRFLTDGELKIFVNPDVTLGRYMSLEWETISIENLDKKIGALIGERI